MKSTTFVNLVVNWKLVPIKLNLQGGVEFDLRCRKFLLFSTLRMVVMAAFFYQMYLYIPQKDNWEVNEMVTLAFRILGIVTSVAVPFVIADGSTKVGGEFLYGTSQVSNKFWISLFLMNLSFFVGFTLLLMPTLLAIESPIMMLIFGLTVFTLIIIGVVDLISGIGMMYIWIQNCITECQNILTESSLSGLDLQIIVDKYETLKFGFERTGIFFFTALQSVVILSAYLTISGKRFWRYLLFLTLSGWLVRTSIFFQLETTKTIDR